MIYWDLLLKCSEEEVPRVLKEHYDAFRSIKAMAEFLGVSDVALYKKLKECNIPRRPRGGAHFRYPREYFPKDWWKLTPDQLSDVTGYAERYCRKLILRKKKELARAAENAGKDDNSNL